MMNFSANGVIRTVAVQIAMVLATLFTADVFLWLFFPTKFQYDPTAFDQDLPGVKRQIVYAVNQYGFRSLSVQQEEKPADVIRILCVGASTTEQSTQNTEDTWCALLEKKLNDASSSGIVRIETASFGRGGWKAIDLYVWARSNIMRFRPDIVITLMGINDLSFNGGPGYSYTSLDDALRNRWAETNKTLDAIKDACKEYSQICRKVVLAKWQVELFLGKRSGRVVEWHSRNLPELRKRHRQLQEVTQIIRTRDPIVEFGDAMDGLLSMLKKSGIEVLVLGQPVLWKAEMAPEEAVALWFSVNTPLGFVRPSTIWMLEEMRRYNEIQARMAARHGALYVDLDSRIPKTLEYYFDDCHYTDAGSNLVASVAFSALKDQMRLMAQK